MAKKPASSEPAAPPVPPEGGSYELVDGVLRKREPDATQTPTPAEAPANQE